MKKLNDIGKAGKAGCFIAMQILIVVIVLGIILIF
jgi:hypothetical protein